MSHSSTIIYSPIGMIADLQSVLGCTGGLGYIIRNANINKWARWKPFRYNAIKFSSTAARLQAMQSVNMGFGTPPGVSITSQVIQHATWTYLRPRGKSYNEMFRLCDFAPKDTTTYGYLHNAVCPLKCEWSESLNEKQPFSCTLNVNRAVTDGTWDSNNNIILSDLFQTSIHLVDLSTYVFALLIVDNDGSGRALASSGVTLSQLSSSSSPSHTMLIASPESPSAGGSVRTIPMLTLAGSRGHTIQMAWVLAPPSMFSQATVLESFSTSNLVSLELEQGIDRKAVQFESYETIAGLQGEPYVAPTQLVAMSGMTDSFQGYTYQLYRLNTLKAYLDVTNASWRKMNAHGQEVGRSSVVIKLDAIGILNLAYIVTSDVVPSPMMKTLNEAAAYYDNPDIDMRHYEPGNGNSNGGLYSAAITKAQGTRNCDLVAETGSVLPDIYIWIRTSVSSGTNILSIDMTAFASVADAGSQAALNDHDRCVYLDTLVIKK